MNELPFLLRNQAGDATHWLELSILGTCSNYDGIGAQVSIFYGQHDQTKEVRSGGSWASQSGVRVHFGLGPIDKIDRLEVRWPSGLTENLMVWAPTSFSWFVKA